MPYYDGRPSSGEIIAAAQSRIAELERMVVWAVEHGAEFERGRLWWFRLRSEGGGDVDTECDGTPASILAAVEKAMGGGE